MDQVASPKATKFYMFLMSSEDLEEKAAKNQERLDKLKTKRDAREQLDAMLREQDSVEAYLRLAETNPAAAALLKTLVGP